MVERNFTNYYGLLPGRGTMTELEELTIARDRIARGWTQGKYVRTADDRETTETDPEVAKWCLLGALRRQAPGQPVASLAVMSRVWRLVNGQNLGEWNDAPGRTQAEVLALLDKAIAEVQAT